MKKSLYAMGLTLVILVFMAFLPCLLGTVEDRRFNAAVSYEEITPMKLEMNNSIIQRLLLLSAAYNSQEISPEQTVLTTEELRTLVAEGIKPYIDCEVLPFSSDFSWELEVASPNLVYDSNGDSADGSVFWVVVVNVVDQGSIELIMDDDMGRILMLGCSVKNYFGKIIGAPKNILHLYMNTYLDSLGIEGLETELLSYDTEGSLHCVTVLLRHPDLSGYIMISFLADEWGLNMQIQSEAHGNIMYDK